MTSSGVFLHKAGVIIRYYWIYWLDHAYFFFFC